MVELTAGLRFIRKQEMKGIRVIHLVRTANQAVATSVPAIAAVLAFVTYTSYHDRLDPVSHAIRAS